MSPADVGRRLAQRAATPVTTLWFNVTTVVALCVAIGTGAWTARSVVEDVRMQQVASEQRLQSEIAEKLAPVAAELHEQDTRITVVEDRLGIRGGSQSAGTVPTSNGD